MFKQRWTQSKDLLVSAEVGRHGDKITNSCVGSIREHLLKSHKLTVRSLTFRVFLSLQM